MKKEPDDPTLRVYTPRHADERPGPNSAGQSGDDMGLSTDEVAGSESVAELVEEEVLLALPMVPKHERCQAAAGSDGDAEPPAFQAFATLKKLNKQGA